jgi:hypothetical protein
MAASRSSLFLFTLTTIIEILLSRSVCASKPKNKQNINFFFCVVCVCNSQYCFVLSSSLSSVCVSSLSSSYLIYSCMHVMPNLCDYYHSLYHSRVLTKRKEINMPYFVRFDFVLLLVVDYLTITTSITTNASSPHQLET